MGARARTREPTFSINFRPRTPLGAQSVPEVRFLTVLGRFRSIWERFWVDLESIFGDFCDIDLKDRRHTDGKIMNHACANPTYTLQFHIDLGRLGHGGGYAAGNWIYIYI